LATGKKAPVSVEENMALVRRFFEARANADLDAIDEMLAPDFVVHTKLFPDQQSELSDREAYKRSVTEYFAAFSDVRFLVEDQVAGADKVVTRFSVSGTHDQREIMGVAPTGREASYMTIVIQRIEGGKIAEEWGVGSSISELREGWVATWQRTEQERIERERIEQELRVARRIQQAALPAAVPELEGWQISPFYQPGRWEETSTTSTSSLGAGWEWSWGTQRARACRQPWSCPLPAACCRRSHKPRTPLRPGRYLSRSTRR
jgi:predicted ester cyclase